MKNLYTIITAGLALGLATLVPAQAPAEPADAAGLYQLSKGQLKQKHTKEAVEAAEKATKLDPTKADYFAQLGIALGTRMSEVGFMQQAAMSGKLKRAFEKAVELDPDNISGLIGLARFYSNAPEIAGGSLEKASGFAERLLKLAPVAGEIELAHIAEKGEKFADALTHYDAALKLQPDHLGALNGSAWTLLKLGREDEARTRFEAVLKISPEHGGARKGLAELDASAAPKN